MQGRRTVPIPGRRGPGADEALESRAEAGRRPSPRAGDVVSASRSRRRAPPRALTGHLDRVRPDAVLIGIGHQAAVVAGSPARLPTSVSDAGAGLTGLVPALPHGGRCSCRAAKAARAPAAGGRARRPRAKAMR